MTGFKSKNEFRKFMLKQGLQCDVSYDSQFQRYTANSLKSTRIQDVDYLVEKLPQMSIRRRDVKLIY
ncbi:hypothetical protein JCM30760_26600 [Thiomicrorhabdus hydrogeniphila]